MPQASPSSENEVDQEDEVDRILDKISERGYEALTDVLFCYHVTAEYDPADPDEHTIPWNDPRVAHLWSTRTPTLSARDAAAEVLGALSPRAPGLLSDWYVWLRRRQTPRFLKRAAARVVGLSNIRPSQASTWSAPITSASGRVRLASV